MYKVMMHNQGHLEVIEDNVIDMVEAECVVAEAIIKYGSMPSFYIERSTNAKVQTGSEASDKM